MGAIHRTLSSMERRRVGRKLLVASIGVASVSYVACGGGGTVANLVAPPMDGSIDAKKDGVVPDVMQDVMQGMDVVANLMPPPMDGGKEGG